jgi:hypothetical protein
VGWGDRDFEGAANLARVQGGDFGVSPRITRICANQESALGSDVRVQGGFGWESRAHLMSCVSFGVLEALFDHVPSTLAAAQVSAQ